MFRSPLTYLVVLAMLGVGCGDDDDGTSSQPEDGPGAFMADFRTSDQFFTQMTSMHDGSSPHGNVQIWYSSNIDELVQASSFDVPEGTTSIKAFDNDGVDGIDGLAVMVKREPGYDPDNNDWYYAMRAADGQLLDTPQPGRVAMCISCHAACAGRDYLCGTELR